MSLVFGSRFLLKHTSRGRFTSTRQNVFSSLRAIKFDNKTNVATCFCRHLSSWQGHGTDLLNESLAHTSLGGIPKIILKGYGPSGIDVMNLIKNKDPTDEELQKSGGIVHMAGSILAFPDACFLWKVRKPEDLTIESLAPILLHTPKLEYLFLGSTEAIPPTTIKKLRDDFSAADMSMVIEPMDVVCHQLSGPHLIAALQ